MDTAESKGVIRKVIEEDGTLLLSFPNHDGYFRLSGTGDIAALKERLLKAQRDREEVSFTFDKNLNILKIGGGPS